MTQVGQARGISVLRTPPRLRLECENGTMTKLVDSCGQCLGAATRSSARDDAEPATRSADSTVDRASETILGGARV